MRLLDIDTRLLWMLLLSGLTAISGIGILFYLEFYLERLGIPPRKGVNPPFYLHKAGFASLVVGMIMLGVTVVILGLSVLLKN